jgi:hypothetical protein
MEETANERGRRIVEILTLAGEKTGLQVQRDYPVVGGRIDLVWFWQGPDSFPLSLPLPALGKVIMSPLLL